MVTDNQRTTLEFQKESCIIIQLSYDFANTIVLIFFLRKMAIVIIVLILWWVCMVKKFCCFLASSVLPLKSCSDLSHLLGIHGKLDYVGKPSKHPFGSPFFLVWVWDLIPNSISISLLTRGKKKLYRIEFFSPTHSCSLRALCKT